LKAFYWKNGVRIDLPSSAYSATATGIAILDGVVCAAGTEGNSPTDPESDFGHPCVWRGNQQKVMTEKGAAYDLALVRD
jgi:hypothetical protein